VNGKAASMKKIIKEINECSRCSLSETRSKTVPGEGNLNTKVVFIGEAPGKKEDELGRPFVGAAGNLFNKLLVEAGFSREDVYILNILKCRPPDNRRPKKSEIDSCKIYLLKQLEVIKPKVVAPMGNSAVNFFQNLSKLKKEAIGDVHGQIFEIKLPWGDLIFFPLYHPAAAIYRQKLVDTLEDDLTKLMKII
jgi:DNA polymerase